MSVFQWVGETVPGTSTPQIATEIGFLRAEDSNAFVGRIDMILANQAAGTQAILIGARSRIQAVYFSGPSMRKSSGESGQTSTRVHRSPVGYDDLTTEAVVQRG